MSRLSAVDSSFLRVETPTAHMHVGWVSILDLPPDVQRLDARALAARMESRLHLAPRFRQRVVHVPLGMGEPVWRDAPDFDVRAHVREADAPGEVTAARLRSLADDFLSRPLARERPLWELLVVPRVRGGRAALLGKVHHAMVDGIAAVELGVLMFDAAADAERDKPVEWTPAPTEGALRLAVDSLADSALEQFRAARRIVSLGASPGQTARIAGTLRRAALSLAEDALRPAPRSYLNVDIGPRRTLVTHRVRLERLLEVKRRHGVTLNDVTLAVCAGALRRFALAAGEPANDLRAMVPVNVRSGDAAAGGNRIAFAFVDLPVSRRRPEERLDAVVRRMGEVKDSGLAGGTAALMRGIGALPEPLKDRAARLAASPRLYNLTISNVPGPQVDLYAAGACVRSIYPVIPVPDRHALAMGLLTYGAHAHLGVYADPEALPRVGRLASMVDDSVVELEGLAARRLSRAA